MSVWNEREVMADPSSASAGGPDDSGRDESSRSDTDGTTGESDDLEALRAAVEEKYDFEDFGPADMEEMTLEEWEAAFDADSWILGDELLKRVEADLRRRIAQREVFAVLEWVEHEGERCLLAYSDQDYALIYPDGSVEGKGTILRDVKPTVALCSMESYDVPAAPAEVSLPHPDEVPEGSGELGNLMLQVVAGMQLLAGLGLVVAWLLLDLPGQNAAAKLIFPAVGLVFVVIGVFLFAVVANARLSDRFRSVEYRERLRKVGLEDGERPDFLPVEPEQRLPEPERHDGGD
jgi:hypothetical protein